MSDNSSEGGEGERTVALSARILRILAASALIAVAGISLSRVFYAYPQQPLLAPKANRSVSRLRRVLVPILKTSLSAHAVELACRVGYDECVELILVHVILVPHKLALDTPLPEQEREAQKVFAMGCSIAAQYGCQSRVRIVHQRHAADGVLQVAKEEKADAIVLGVGSEERVPGEWEHTITDILHHAECEVIIDRVPLGA